MKIVISFFIIIFILGCKKKHSESINLTDSASEELYDTINSRTQNELLKKYSDSINLNFTYISGGACKEVQESANSRIELIKAEKTKNSIIINVDKHLTGLTHYGKARIENDTLILDYWINENPDYIASVIVPSRLKYEIVNIHYKAIKVNYLGNIYD